MPTSVAPAKKSTFVTVAGPVALAVAERATGLPNTTAVPAVGDVSATEGPVTLTFAINEVAVAANESVTRAVSETLPVAVGVQLTV